VKAECGLVHNRGNLEVLADLVGSFNRAATLSGMCELCIS
jgi:hypothetical protein